MADKFTTMVLGDDASGAFDRVQLPGITPGLLQGNLAGIKDDANYLTGPFVDWHVVGCVDCRRETVGVSLAGGMMSLVVALVAAHGREGRNLLQVLQVLAQDYQFRLVLHQGCGAFDRFVTVMKMLAGTDDRIYRLLERLGVPIDDTTYGAIATEARFMQGAFMPDSWETARNAVLDLGGTVEYFQIRPHHSEVRTCANLVPGSTLNRNRLPATANAFALDWWAVETIVEHIGGNRDLAQLMVRAYNAGVLLSLGGPKHEIVIRK